MDQAIFTKFQELVYENSGICLNAGKEALISARVSKRMRTLGINEYKSYLEVILHDRTGKEVIYLLDNISTNVTSFYREPQHFEFISEIYRRWIAKGQTRFRFWSAASSTGEEPYTLAITLNETANGRLPDTRILATDISTRVLEKCNSGCYEGDKLQTVPAPLREKYFHREAATGSYRVKESLKNMILFRRLNLSVTPFGMRGPLDMILCRNVMIYFDNTMRRKLLGEMYRLLKPNGYLIVGHAESLTGMVSDFKVVQPSIYIKV